MVLLIESDFHHYLFLLIHHPIQFLRFNHYPKEVSALKVRAEANIEIETTSFEFFVAVLRHSADDAIKLVQFSTALVAPATADSKPSYCHFLILI